MTQLAPGNFTGTGKKASGGQYKGMTYTKIVEAKIENDLSFIMGSSKVYGKVLSTSDGKVTLSYSNSKGGKVSGKELISKFLKDPDFGGGKGSGGGAADTVWTESLQCYYTSLLYNTSLTKLDNKNTTNKLLKEQDEYCFTYNKNQKVNFKTCFDNGPEDWFKNDVYIKTANAIYNSNKGKKFKGKKVYFHRGSPFMNAIYAIKKKCLDHDKKSKESIAPGSFNDDKWNPGDIWMSKLLPSTKEPLDKGGFCPCEFTDVRQGIQEAADSGTTLGVSLKKVETSTASVQEFNTPKRTHNKVVNYLGFTFGQTGDFFNSADIYLYFSTGKMQLRATATTKSWQGEIKGQFAAGGKIGGGNVNYYTEKNMGKSIGKAGKVANWSEIGPNEGKTNINNFYKLYQKYDIKQMKQAGRKTSTVKLKDFKTLVEGYRNNKGQPAAPAFYFGKYQSLLFLDTIYSKGKKELNSFATDVIRYAASNTDISTFFIKVS
tara:strand:- start:66 stop:1529 length:1464 start_codon:yes stop_codon:yes gene_type:complete